MRSLVRDRDKTTVTLEAATVDHGRRVGPVPGPTRHGDDVGPTTPVAAWPVATAEIHDPEWTSSTTAR